MEDIFVPTSSADDALVGPLHTVTYVTADRETVERVLIQGYDLTASGWQDGDAATKAYLGFAPEHDIAICGFTKVGAGANLQIRVIHVAQETPQVRPEHLGLYKGGATISAPMTDMRAHEERMKALGIRSTIGVKEMEFTSPAGETYTSAEIVYMMPENVFLMGVTRPSIFVPTGPMDPATGMGAPSYSARCMTETDAILAFLREVMGYEVRRDLDLHVGERSALLMPEGTVERFAMAFAPGASTGYLVIMDHREATQYGDAPGYGPPNRGIVMWSFLTANLDAVARRAAAFCAKVLQHPGSHGSPLMPAGRSMILEDPDGFPIEIVEA